MRDILVRHPFCIPKSMADQIRLIKVIFLFFFCSASRTESRGSIICQPKWSAMWQLKSSQFCIISLVCLMVAYQMFECFFPRTWPIFELKNYRFINMLWPSGFKQYDKIRQNVPSLNYTYWSVGEGIWPYRVIPRRFGRHRQSGLPPFYLE